MEQPFPVFLEPQGNPPANRATTGVELGEYFPVVRAGLDIQQIARVKDGFSVNRQTEARQFLGDLNA